MEIKTIKNRVDHSETFDIAVNNALSEGWTLITRQVLQSQAENKFSLLYAEFVKDDTPKETSLINNQTIIDTIKFYGRDMMLNVCIEELSELIKELCKDKRGLARPDNIAEEMADVKIIMSHLDTIYNNGPEVDAWIVKKLERLKRRISEEGKT